MYQADSGQMDILSPDESIRYWSANTVYEELDALLSVVGFLEGTHMLRMNY